MIGGGQRIPKDLQDSIRNYLIEKSNIGANRLVENKNPNDENYKQKIPVRYLEENNIELYKMFPFREQLSNGTFYKYLKMTGEFKKPFRWTDLCDYCEKGKQIRADLYRLLEPAHMEYEWQETLDLSHVRTYLESRRDDLLEKLKVSDQNQLKERIQQEIDEIATAIDNTRDYETIQFHKNIARLQRIAYNSHRTDVNVLRGSILIEADFKQKFIIGMGPRQINSEYYKQQQRSCLGEFLMNKYQINLFQRVFFLKRFWHLLCRRVYKSNQAYQLRHYLVRPL